MTEKKEEGAQSMLSTIKVLALHFYLLAFGLLGMCGVLLSIGVIDMSIETLRDIVSVLVIPVFAYIVLRCLGVIFWAIFDIFIPR